MNGPRHYTYVSIDPIESDQQGRNPSYWVTHVSYGKESEYSKDSPSPYLLPNEWICGHIANFLRLPSPPFAVMKNSNGPALFTNLQFTPEHLPPPDATAANCWRVDKHTCTGIFLFDLLVLNHDRKPRNLYVDNPRQPREILVYDHDDALSGAMFDGATEYMSKRLIRRSGEVG